MSTDDLTLDPEDLNKVSRSLVRVGFLATGIAAIILGILLFVVPGRTLQLAAIVLGVNFMVAGGMRIWLGAFGQLPHGHHRVLGILFGALLLITGLIILRDSAAAAATLLLVIVIFAGIGWILDGIMAIVESGRARSRVWAVLYGVLSILAGIVVLAIPGWSATWLVIFAAIALVVIGIAAIIRSFMFGRGVPLFIDGSADK